VCEVDSAGTHGYHIGDAPDHRAIRTALGNGTDLSDLRARKLIRQDFDRFDLILAMDHGHLDFMENLSQGKSAGKLKKFLDFSDNYKGEDVPDPYYGSDQGFED
jgi:protein-tyrosine phosphatase